MEYKEIPKFSWSEVTCGEACWSAKHTECHCSCNGKNHGIWITGGKPEFRTCKLNSITYKLLATGNQKRMKEIQAIELGKYGLYRCYNYNGKDYHQTYLEYFNCRGDKNTLNFPLVCKLATIEQCRKWHELSEYKDIDNFQRYKSEPALLWQIIKEPEPVKHECKNLLLTL